MKLFLWGPFKPSGYENLPLTPETDDLIDPLKKTPVEPPRQPTRIQQELGPKCDDSPVNKPVPKPEIEIPQPVISPIVEVCQNSFIVEVLGLF